MNTNTQTLQPSTETGLGPCLTGYEGNGGLDGGTVFHPRSSKSWNVIA